MCSFIEHSKDHRGQNFNNFSSIQYTSEGYQKSKNKINNKNNYLYNLSIDNLSSVFLTIKR